MARSKPPSKNADLKVTGASQGVRIRRPERDARQQCILDATIACIRQSGFQRATIASIAEMAGMSAGNLYRYFPSKEAILEAIALRDLADMRLRFDEMAGLDRDGTLSFLTSTLVHLIDRQFDPNHATVALDLVAEAARNPNVRAIVADVDRQERAAGLEILGKLLPEAKGATGLEVRSELIRALLQGMLLRGVLNSKIDRVAFKALFAKVLTFVLTETV